jgi:hypothetical protein
VVERVTRTEKKTTDGTIGSILGVRSNVNQRREHDAYMTQAVFVKALCGVEDIPKRLWEPFAGDGQMAKVLGMYCSKVVESDIKPRCKNQKKLDFLQVKN